jgi:hypothetical protein
MPFRLVCKNVYGTDYDQFSEMTKNIIQMASNMIVTMQIL